MVRLKLSALSVLALLTGTALQAAPVTFLVYSAYGTSGGPGCGDVSTSASGLANPSAPLVNISFGGDCSVVSRAEVTETLNTLDLAITTATTHGANMWSFGAGGAYVDLLVNEAMTFSVNGTMDASPGAAYNIYIGLVYDLGAGSYVYLSEQLSTEADELLTLGGDGGNINGVDPWGNAEAHIFPSSYTLQAGHTYRLQGHIWNQSVAGQLQSWQIYNPGAGTALSTWNFHLEAVNPVRPPDVIPPVAAVPEPGTLALMGLGLAGLGLAIRRRRSR